jgi:hypothetical protein
MPNDCWNNITIYASNSQIRAILLNEFCSVPEWAFSLIQVGEEALQFRLWSPDAPAREFMALLWNNYEGLWMKNEWSEEGGGAGVIVGRKMDAQSFEWTEGCIEEIGHRFRTPESPMPAPALLQPDAASSLS